MTAEMEYPKIRQGLVVHPGDHLILTFPAPYGEYKEEILRRIQAGFPENVKLSLVFGAEQIAVVRHD